MLISVFINSIYFFDDKIVIAYNYMDKQETVMLKDINCSDIMVCSRPKIRGGP